MSRAKTGSSRSTRPGLTRLISAWARNHLAVAIESLLRIRRAPLQSFLMIAVIAIACSLPASLYLLAGTVKSVSGDVSRTTDIQVFFTQEANRQEVEQLTGSWSQLADVESLVLIDPETGRSEFEAFSGLGSVLDLLEENPLPHVVRITPSESIARNRLALDSLVGTLSEPALVDEVQFDFAWLERLDSLLNLIDRVNLVIGFMLGLGIVLILINSIRLMIDNRRDEIVIVKLVGGTNEFVRRPLLYTGLWLGLLGGLGALLLTDLAVLAVGSPINLLLGSYEMDITAISPLSAPESLILLMLSSGLGLLGAWLAVAQHLSSIEPR